MPGLGGAKPEWASEPRPRVPGDLGPDPVCSASILEPVKLSNNNGPRVFNWSYLHARTLADFRPAKT